MTTTMLIIILGFILLCVYANGHSSLRTLRHYRHVGDHRYSNEQRSSSYGSQTNSNDNHFPMFPNCSSYHPTIQEDQPTGAYVINVLAVDPDPLEKGGKLTYSFVADPKEQVRFHIDNNTGVITTKYMFNRDEPAREKEAYIIVRATDNGKPELDAICAFIVTIEDINDNSPTFDKVSYSESIPQDLEPGAQVMRITATDIDDGLNKEIVYGLQENTSSKYINDEKYFSVNEKTGIVTLNKKLNGKDPGYLFKIIASATDKGSLPKTSFVNLEIMVIESNKKPPYFIGSPPHDILLKENFTNLMENIATFKAMSNTDEDAPIFRLVTGKSEERNKMDTFLLTTRGNEAFLRLASPSLDYEKVKEYTLSVRIENKYGLAVEHTIIVKIEDVNDVAPKFTKELKVGSVLEDEPIGTPVMQVSAIDLDETPAFKKITYELAGHTDKFRIDPRTGNITTLVRFDREEKDSYSIKVIAKDGAPSSNLDNGEPNSGEQDFRISIEDKNDHSPEFEHTNYTADVSENSDKDSVVMEVHAKDADSASTIRYSITDGNIDDAFYVVAETGAIKIKTGLDYEKVTNYSLTLQADDGLFKVNCNVLITVTDVNDNNPIFEETEKNIEIDEEELISGCIVRVRAYDPDIRDRNAPQDIVYSLVKSEHKDFMKINNDGCLSLIKPLDRDKPNGTDLWQVIIKANDEGGPSKPSSLASTATVFIKLRDKNDNAPFLNMTQPVVWRENQSPGRIIQLKAHDYDGPDNGEPFTFELAPEASSVIRQKFSIAGEYLEASEIFDREEQKEYRIPISITDSGDAPMTGVSYLTVIIGDDNDNPMKEGSSSIFVYYFQGASTAVEIGRVYVDDPDDWDLPDKIFEWEPYEIELIKYFTLSSTSGMITMEKAPTSSYVLRFKVTEEPKNRRFSKHSVSAIVNVTVKEIPEEAVTKSGSIRFEGITAEEFITRNEDGKNRADLLKSQLALALNNSEDNIDVFTILSSPVHKNPSLVDVRFSAHGSPYYPAEQINAAVVKNQEEIENVLNAKMLMINVDECLTEKANCESSCTNKLKYSNVPAQVFTNTTSFIGIQAYVDYECQCKAEEMVCLNGGSLMQDGRCQCPESFDGPSCEPTSVGFSGNGWALYPPFSVCEHTQITLYIRPQKPDGLIFYVGPETMQPSSLKVQDFIALELRKGYPILLVDYGTGTAKIEHFHIKVDDNNFHKIDIFLSPTSIELIVDDCRLQKCLSLTPPNGINKYLNVNGPLQVGGTYMDLAQVSRNLNWTHKPIPISFTGCVQNFTLNGKPYNLGQPSIAESADSGCSRTLAANIVFGFDWTFLIAILVCLAGLTILLMAVAVHRRKVEDMYRDTDDIRENIINYEDEGGGEGDMTGYDLNVLRLHYEGPVPEKYMNGMLPSTGVDEVPDICGFLDDKKHSVDNDPETLPFDNVRQYAYEGDGNTTGSLSSLASGTDEGDLNFDYLSNFGPRFRKLADMYGEDGSDEDSDTYHNATSESWC